jgi:hypothetical protein
VRIPEEESDENTNCEEAKVGLVPESPQKKDEGTETRSLN